jgi:NDP-sugar pyrophosphorylase family protein
MKINIVMPMAGLGSRFRDVGYDIPKPLIPVIGKPMYTWATDSLPLEHCARLIFILLESQPEFEELKADILKRYASHNPLILGVTEVTRGQSETVLAAKHLINSNTPLLIHNADTGYEIDSEWIDSLESQKPDGALLVFESEEDRWSFSREDDTGRVIEVREKEPISCWASTGTYYFARGKDFVRFAEERINEHQLESGEFYIAPIYNDLIAQGATIRNYRINKLLSFGTPEDLDNFLKHNGDE